MENKKGLLRLLNWFFLFTLLSFIVIFHIGMKKYNSIKDTFFTARLTYNKALASFEDKYKSCFISEEEIPRVTGDIYKDTTVIKKILEESGARIINFLPVNTGEKAMVSIRFEISRNSVKRLFTRLHEEAGYMVMNTGSVTVDQNTNLLIFQVKLYYEN